MVKIFYTGALVLALAACGGGQSPSARANTTVKSAAPGQGPIAKPLFTAMTSASQQAPMPIGSYSKGCLAGGVQLAETGPTWQAMRLSRNRNWGHPVLIDYVKELSRKVARLPGWEGLYVGDLGLPRGGPVKGHASHQIGMDVDIWMLPPNRLNLTRTERENLSSISTRRAAGAYTNSNWTESHRNVLKLAASDPRVGRILVFPGAKVDLCNWEKGDRSYLSKIRPWYGHHYHFHVRLNCQPGQTDCVAQAPVPRGDGCAAAQEWVDNILNPPPPDPNAPPPRKKGELRMGDLPAQCAAVLASN